MALSTIIEQNKTKISELCELHGVRKLYAFGSVLSNNFNENSDIDLLVDFKSSPKTDPFLNFFDFIYSLEELFGRKVDLVDETALTNKCFKDNIFASRKLIYG